MLDNKCMKIVSLTFEDKSYFGEIKVYFSLDILGLIYTNKEEAYFACRNQENHCKGENVFWVLRDE